MIYLPFSKFVDTGEQVIAPGSSITQEGQALVRLAGNPSAGVGPSAGTTGEIFAGFSIAGTSAAPYMPVNASKVETFVVPAVTAPALKTVTLAFAPVSGQYSVFDVTGNAVATGVSISGKVITFGANSAATNVSTGDIVQVTYQYALSVTQARAIVGDVQPGGYIGDYIGQVGTVKRGTIYTDQFDATRNWGAATTIKLTSNGQITEGTGSLTGVTISGYVVALPTTDVPFLGIQFDIE